MILYITTAYKSWNTNWNWLAEQNPEWQGFAKWALFLNHVNYCGSIADDRWGIAEAIQHLPVLSEGGSWQLYILNRVEKHVIMQLFNPIRRYVDIGCPWTLYKWHQFYHLSPLEEKRGRPWDEASPLAFPASHSHHHNKHKQHYQTDANFIQRNWQKLEHLSISSYITKVVITQLFIKYSLRAVKWGYPGL